MSKLFGHKKGAFTGATGDRKGLLMEANGGMLFLDEIGELGLDEQAMLLRAIEERRFSPMGTEEEVESEFQLICGTNRDLDEECANGRFRADLLERINMWSFTLPGLAERREDIEANIEHDLECLREETGEYISFNKEAHDRFLDFALSPDTPWHGNFRELNARIERMATLSKNGHIDCKTVEEEIARDTGRRRTKTTPSDDLSDLAPLLGDDYRTRYDMFDLVQLAYVVRTCREKDSIAEAGRHLYASSRLKMKKPNDTDRLRKYLDSFGLSFKKLKEFSRK